MKTKYTLFRRGEVFYIQDSATGKQTSLRTKDETEAKSLLNARNEAQRQPVLNLHLARAYLTASDPAFVERTWQTVMDQLQARGKDSSRERYTTVFKSTCFDALRRKKLLETTADDFFAVFKDGKVSIVYFLKRLHNFALSLGWIALPVVAPYLWPKYEAKDRRGITRDEQETIITHEKKAEWKLFLELLWETGAAQGDAAALTAEHIDWQSRTITYFRQKTGSRAQFTISKTLETVLSHLPTTGALFPNLSTFTANDRANLQHRDVAIVVDDATGERILEIEVRGKRGVGYCKSMPSAVRPYERLLARPLPGLPQGKRARKRRGETVDAPPASQEVKYPQRTDHVFPGNHIKLFNGVLKRIDLKKDRDGNRRTAYSLRHTYICMRLMEGADIYQIAKNCRTSVEMIEKFYAAHIKNTLDAAAINVLRPKRKHPKDESVHEKPQHTDEDDL